MEWEERDTSKVSFGKHCIAGKYFEKINNMWFVGACAGIMEHLGLYPVDTIKVSVILRD